MITAKTSFRGHFNGTVDDLIRPFVLKSSTKLDRARGLAVIYLKYDRKFAIRADIAFAQMIHETGYLEYKGDVKPDQNNFAGIGATGGVPGNSFETEGLGVLAQFVHLAWYYYPDHVNSLCSMTYDPRHFGNTHYKYTGDTSIDFLSGQWAVPGKYKQPDGSIITYGGQIAKIANIINGENVVIIEPVIPPKPVVNKDLDIIIQMGHVGRTKGATGTAGEQTFNKALGDEIEKLLKGGPLNYRIMGADNWTTPKPNKATVFFSLHADGSTNTSARGFSMGFKPGTNEVFKEYIAKAYKELCKFNRRRDNYTQGMVKYYSWKHIDCQYTALIEHGFMTNPIERAWMTSHIKEIAKCHVSSILKFFKEVKDIG